MADKFKFEIFYSLSGVQKTSRVYPIFEDTILNKDLTEYKDDIKCTSTFTFINKAADGVFDFDIIKSIESEDIFQKATLKVSKLKNNQYQYFKTFFFSVVDAEVNNDRCTATVTPLFEDKYACLYDTWEKEYNILKEVGNAQKFDIDNPVNLELFTSKSTFKILIGCPNGNNDPLVYAGPLLDGTQVVLPLLVDQSGTYFNWTPSGLFIDLPGVLGPSQLFSVDTYPPHFAYHHHEIFSTENFYTTNYPYYGYAQYVPIWDQINKWRIYKNVFHIKENWDGNVYVVEVETTWCCETTFVALDSIGNIVNPSGTGWIHFLATTYAGIPGMIFGREPFYDKFEEYDTDPAYDNLGHGNYAYSYFHWGDCHQFEFRVKNPYTWADATNLEIHRGRYLVNTIERLLYFSGCGLTFKSQFLNNSQLGQFNPVNTTNHVNELNPVYILNHCKDIKAPLNTDTPQTELFLSLKTLLTELETIFNAKWYLKDNFLIFEHISYFENNYSYTFPNNAPTIDLSTRIDTQTGKPELISTSKYKYNTGEIFDKETWEMQQYLDYDFAKLSIDYNIQLNGGNKEKAQSISMITDVAGVISEPTKFNDEGIVMVACLYRDGVLTSVNEKGYRTNKDVTNGYLCLSNLFDRFYRHGRVLLKGQLDAETDNGQIVNEDFYSAIYKKIQEIEVRDCDGEVFLNNNLIKTPLGTGRVLISEHRAKKDTTKLTILI